jgi:hypothetical protein
MSMRDKFKRLSLNLGLSKSHEVPLEANQVEDGAVHTEDEVLNPVYRYNNLIMYSADGRRGANRFEDSIVIVTFQGDR